MPIVSQGTTQEFRVGATDGIFVKCTGSAAITYDGEFSAPTLADASTGEVRCGYFGVPATIRVNCVSGTCEVNTQPTVIKPLVSKQGGAAQDSSALDVAQAVNQLMGGGAGLNPTFDSVTLKGLPQTSGAPAGHGDLASAVNAASVESVKFLPQLPVSGVRYSVTGYYANSTVGGGDFVYDALRGKADHNGGTVIAPEAIAAWDGTSSNLSQILSWTGSGFGCYVRVSSELSISAECFGLSEGVQNAALPINAALAASQSVTLPEGGFSISTFINMPLNSTLAGSGSLSTVIKISSALANAHILRYGSAYEYSGYRGAIQRLRFESATPGTNLGLGVLLNSGIKFFDVAFFELKSAVVKPAGSYIDRIEIDRCYFGACTGDPSNAVINIAGEADAFKMSNCHGVAFYQESTAISFRDGLFLDRCNSAEISNNIFNLPIKIDRSFAVSITSHHNEGSQHPTYKGNKSFVEISRSAVEISGAYFHQRVDGANIRLIRVSPTDTQETCTLNISSARFVTTPMFDYLLASGGFNQIDVSALCTLTVDGVYSTDVNPAINSNPLIGISVVGSAMFNRFSNFFSRRAVIANNGTLLSPNMLTVNDANMRTNLNRHQSSGSNANVPWYKAGDVAASYTFTSVLVYDDGRKLAALRNTSPQTVTNVTTGSRGILVRNNSSQNTDGFGAFLRYYRGASAANYDSYADVPISTAYYLYDKGTNVSGSAVLSRANGDIDTFTYVNSFKLLDSTNVEFEAASPPAIGVFVSGDICKNTSKVTGQVIFWTYNGSAWVASGNYA